jgi:selenocysteine-specific elongation factor
VHVVATAGHVDHGKSTLVRALTGMEPDRWAEERRRGLTIDLGFAWADIPGAGDVAFVDVPGHERFIGNMLAGVGAVPAVLFVVAADGGWMPQSSEHLAAIDALGVADGVLAVTRCDLADPRPVASRALAELRGSSLGEVPWVAVSGRTGGGMDELRREIAGLVARLPDPQPAADVRLWVDRSFTVRGAGTVVTGTLAAGTLRTHEELELMPSGRRVRARRLETLGRRVEQVAGTARVAVNLRGVERSEVGRGMALVSPGRWLTSDLIDVRVPADGLVGQLVVHVGAAAIPARVRRLGASAARLTLAERLPLRVGDRLLLRDPGDRSVVGADVLDVRPPRLSRRGAAAARAAVLASVPARPDAMRELAQRRLIAVDQLRAMGADVSALDGAAAARVVGKWAIDREHWAHLRESLVSVVDAHRQEAPLESGPSAEAVRRALNLPDRRLVDALVADLATLATSDGRVVRVHGWPADLPAPVRAAVDVVRAELAASPFAAPEAPRLAELGLGASELAAAIRAGELVRIADGIYLLADAEQRAAAVLATLDQPFTLSAARQAMATSRRVAVPLLEHLDRRGVTVRVDERLRRVRDAR